MVPREQTWWDGRQGKGNRIARAKVASWKSEPAFSIPSNGAKPPRQTGLEKARAGVSRELGTGTNTNRACLLHLGHTIQCSGGPAVLWPPEVGELARKICLWE